MFQFSPSLVGAARLHAHPLPEPSAPLPAHVALEMLRLHRGIIAGLRADRPNVVHFTGAHHGAGTTRVVSSLAETVGRSGVSVGSMELHDLPEVTLTRLPGRDSTKGGLPVRADSQHLDPSEVVDHVTHGERFGLVLLDTPPIVGSALSMALAGAANGTVLVIEAERTTDAQVREALDRIVDCGGTCLGIAFNKRRGGPKPRKRRFWHRGGVR